MDASVLECTWTVIAALMVQVPGLESEAGEDAARFLNSAAAGKHLVAIVERRERGIPRSKDRVAQPPRLHVLLSELGARPGGAETANAALLEQGLAQVQRLPKHQVCFHLALDKTALK